MVGDGAGGGDGGDVGDGGDGGSVAPADEVATVQQLWRKEDAFVGETRQRQ